MNPPIQNKNEEDAGRSAKTVSADAAKKGVPKTEKAKKPEAAKKAAKKIESSPSVWINRLRQYLREVSFELRKVVWPSRKETLGSTVVVVVIVLLAGAFLGVVDAVLSKVVRMLVG